MKDALASFREVSLIRQKDIRDELLRVPVNEWEPGALHMHHDSVPLLESMQYVRHGPRYRGR